MHQLGLSNFTGYSNELQGEAHPPKPQPNGDIKPTEQLKLQLMGDASHLAVQAEGLLDGSEDLSKT